MLFVDPNGWPGNETEACAERARAGAAFKGNQTILPWLGLEVNGFAQQKHQFA